MSIGMYVHVHEIFSGGAGHILTMKFLNLSLAEWSQTSVYWSWCSMQLSVVIPSLPCSHTMCSGTTPTSETPYPNSFQPSGSVQNSHKVFIEHTVTCACSCLIRRVFLFWPPSDWHATADEDHLQHTQLRYINYFFFCLPPSSSLCAPFLCLLSLSLLFISALSFSLIYTFEFPLLRTLWFQVLSEWSLVPCSVG